MRDQSPGERDQARTRRRQAAAYQAAFEAVFAILIGAGLGYAGDEWLGSEPWLLLLGFAIGFAAFVLRLVRLGRRLQQTGAGDGPGSEGS